MTIDCGYNNQSLYIIDYFETTSIRQSQDQWPNFDVTMVKKWKL